MTTYVAQQQRQGLALCLSGGGFRAALFHLGALRRLNELGVLSQVDTIASVSGGSILAAHLAQTVRPWPGPGEPVPDWDTRVARPFHQIAARNARTPAILSRLLPWNWPRSSTGVETLSALYERRVSAMKLRDLPERPRFVFCATDMAFGVNWTFERDRCGDYRVGYAATPAEWPVARAVAASSAFPPVFNPLRVRLPPDAFQEGHEPPGPERDAALSDLRLTDGGVYDNLGLEPVWKSHATLLVSDGGATLDFEPDRGLLRRIKRYSDIIAEQVSALRKRWLVSNFISGSLAGTYWGVGSAVSSYDIPGHSGYSKELVTDTIAEIRTDLDAFSTPEMEILENHGYALAGAAIARHAAQLAGRAAPLVPPHSRWANEDNVRRALAGSEKRKLLGRW